MTMDHDTLGEPNLQAKTISNLINGLSLMAVDNKNLHGLVIKGRSGPIRQKVFHSISKLFNDHKFRKIHPQVLDSELFGGLDFTKTFEVGRPVKTRGYLNSPHTIIAKTLPKFGEK